MPGMGELIIILLIVLVVFGAGKLPAIGDALGRSIKNFKRSVTGGDEIEVNRRDEIESGRARGEISAGNRDVHDAEVRTPEKERA